MFVAVGTLVIIIIVACILTVMKIKEFVRKHGIHNIAGRAITLRPLHGKKKTNATFWRNSTDRASGKSTGRHHRAGWKNLCISLWVITGLTGLAYGVFRAFFLTAMITGVIIVAIIVLTIVVMIRTARRWHSNRSLITPLAVAAASIIDPDSSLGIHPETLIRMAPDWLTVKKGRIGDMFLPDAFHANPGQRNALEHLIGSRLPVPVKFTWLTKKLPQRVVFLVAPPLPKMVRFRDYLKEIAALPDDEFLLGIDGDGSNYIGKHSGDTPWHGRCAGSGTGKSVGFMVKSAQILHKDRTSEIYAVDTKQVSFAPLRGIPGMHIYDDPFNMGDIYQMFYNLLKIMQDRYSQLKKDPTAIDRFNNIWLFVDEGNDMAVQLAAYYQKHLRGPGEPKQPPVWLEAIGPIIWQGRQVKIRGELMLQNLMDRYLGGISLRPSLSTIGMAGYKPNQWRTIIGTSPVPECQTGPGRICMVNGNDERWIQSLYDDTEYLRHYAEANRVANATKLAVA